MSKRDTESNQPQWARLRTGLRSLLSIWLSITVGSLVIEVVRHHSIAGAWPIVGGATGGAVVGLLIFGLLTWLLRS